MNTKRLAIGVLVLLGALVLSACSLLDKGQSADPQAAAPTSALPKAAQLLVGIVKLEETDLAVTPEQAAALLPLWKMSRSLSTSDSAAQEESEALTVQIEETLSADQRAAIEQMALGPESLREAMQVLGLESGAAGGAELTAEQEATRTALRQAAGGARGQGGFADSGGGGQGGGGAPGGGAFVMRDGGAPGGLPQMDPAQLATLQAGGGARGGMTMGINRALYDALIRLLTERAGV
jgi:hypothetical protein